MRMVHLPAGRYDGVPERSRCVLRKDRVLETLRSLSSQRPVQNGVLRRYSGYSAEEVAEQAQVDRTNASRDLNLLVQEGMVERISGRPVLFAVKMPFVGIGSGLTNERSENGSHRSTRLELPDEYSPAAVPGRSYDAS